MNTPATTQRERLRLKISLERLPLAIWRRVEIDDGLSFWQLHRVIQVAMGWDDAHLHEFRVAGLRIAMPLDADGVFGGDEPALPEDTATLAAWRSGQKTFRYGYDFGDDWWHSISIEKRLLADPAGPRAVLLAGRGACPPEDCGGADGYAELLASWRDPAAADYARSRECLGDDFDPGRVRPGGALPAGRPALRAPRRIAAAGSPCFEEAARTHQGSILMHQGSISIYQGSILTHQGSISIDQGSILIHQGSILTHQGSISIDQGSILTPQGGILIPQGSILMHQGSISVDQGSILRPQGSVGMPRASNPRRRASPVSLLWLDSWRATAPACRPPAAAAARQQPAVESRCRCGRAVTAMPQGGRRWPVSSHADAQAPQRRPTAFSHPPRRKHP